MTISIENITSKYNGNDVLDVFSYTFTSPDEDWIIVILDGITLSDTLYTINLGSKEVTMNTAPATGEELIITRIVPLDQEIDYNSYDPFPADTHESALDKLTMIVQQNENAIERSLRFPIGDESSVVLPNIIDRANKFVTFDPSGDVSVTGDPGVDLSMEWAINPEDDLISVEAGGDGSTDYSSLHWAAKSQSLGAAQVSLATDQVALAEGIYDTFNDRYLGSFSSDPTTLNDGITALDASNDGIEYWDSTLKVRKTFNGSTLLWGLTSASAATNAVDVNVADAGGYYGASPNVETALQEVGSEFAALPSKEEDLSNKTLISPSITPDISGIALSVEGQISSNTPSTASIQTGVSITYAGMGSATSCWSNRSTNNGIAAGFVSQGVNSTGLLGRVTVVGYGVQGRADNASGYCFYATGVGNNYGPFTGSHDGLVLKTAVLEVGDILVDNVKICAKNVSNTIFENKLSSVANEKAVIGVVASLGLDLITGDDTESRRAAALIDMSEVDYDALVVTHNRMSFNAVGEGQVNVCGEGGDLEPGDLIVASNTVGKGMKQSDDIVRGYTVAKCREAVTFSSPSEVKMIACIYLCG